MQSAQSETNLSLCKGHYLEWYRYTHPESHLNCKPCGKRLESSSKRPEPLTLEKFLRKSADFEGNLQPEDQVCYTCYRSQSFSSTKNAVQVLTQTYKY